MIKNIFKIILLLVLIFSLGLLTFFVYNYLKQEPKNDMVLEEKIDSIEDQIRKAEEVKKQAKENSKNLYNEQFPDFIEGTLIIISETEAKIINEQGEEFFIDPARPVAYYLESGVKSGSKAILQGKITDEKTVFLGNIKPLIAE